MIRFILIGFIIFSSFFSFAQFEEEIDHKAIYNGAYFISKNAAGQYGVITDKGQTKVPFVYSRIIENDLGLFVFKINKSNGFERSYSLGYYDHQFKMVLPCQFNSLLSLEDGLIIGSQNLDKKFGLVDTLGRIIIPFEYDEMFAPTESLFLTKLNGKYGFINKKNHVVIDHKFTYAAPFSEGLAAASKSNLIGFIDRKGDFEIKERFTSADDFQYGYAQVFFHNQTSVVDSKGMILLPPIFKSIHSVGNGQFVFEASPNLRSTLASTLPKLTIAQNIEELSQYDSLVTTMDSEIDSEVIEEKFMGVMNSIGQLIGGNEFQQVIALYSDGTNQLYAVQRKSDNESENSNYNFALMDGNGKILTEYRFFEIKPDEKIVVEETENGFVNYHVDSSGKLSKIN
ncbi:WG repeat-containing protein [Fluviicola taffensis]|uniref:WG repeat-containing protein n=1 Tax=Fluviicola taffensis TaxID=191579 RepID=UPI0031381288